MKISALFLAASLALNVALAALLVVGAGAPAPVPRIAPPAVPVAAKTAATLTPETWETLRAGDLAARRDRLQAEGFPPSLIRAILAAEIRESFSARRKALDAAQRNAPFWKDAPVDPQTQAELRALAKAENQALKDLLGPDRDNGFLASLHRQFPSWSADKVEQLAAIRERYDEQRSDIYSQARNAMTPDDRQKIVALDKAMHSEFATVLTPAELDDYDLRTSDAANQLRSRFTAFDPTEAEFRALYKLQGAFDDQWRYYTPLPPDQMRARSDAQKQLNDDIKAALGPERYDEYQRATDYNFRQTTQLVARLELPPETATQLWTVQKEFEEKRSDLYRNRDVTGDARTQQLTALASEATARVTPLLGGERGVEAYKMNGGQWITYLVPRPAPKP